MTLTLPCGRPAPRVRSCAPLPQSLCACAGRPPPSPRQVLLSNAGTMKPQKTVIPFMPSTLQTLRQQLGLNILALAPCTNATDDPVRALARALAGGLAISAAQILCAPCLRDCPGSVFAAAWGANASSLSPRVYAGVGFDDPSALRLSSPRRPIEYTIAMRPEDVPGIELASISASLGAAQALTLGAGFEPKFTAVLLAIEGAVKSLLSPGVPFVSAPITVSRLPHTVVSMSANVSQAAITPLYLLIVYAFQLVGGCACCVCLRVCICMCAHCVRVCLCMCARAHVVCYCVCV